MSEMNRCPIHPTSPCSCALSVFGVVSDPGLPFMNPVISWTVVLCVAAVCSCLEVRRSPSATVYARHRAKCEYPNAAEHRTAPIGICEPYVHIPLACVKRHC